MTKKTCPACGNQIRHRSGGRCPECDTKLEIFRPEDGSPSVYILFDPDAPQVRELEAASQSGRRLVGGGLKISKGNEVPQIFLVGGNKYRVIYQGVIYRNDVYCPACGKMLFRNITMESGPNEQEHKCPKCKAIVSYIFDPRFKVDIMGI